MEFIHVIDNLFDILNSCNPCAKGLKSELSVKNKGAWDPFLDKAHDYILGLKDAFGQPMYTTRRKTGFVGFLLAIKSIKGIFQDFVEPVGDVILFNVHDEDLSTNTFSFSSSDAISSDRINDILAAFSSSIKGWFE